MYTHIYVRKDLQGAAAASHVRRSSPAMRESASSSSSAVTPRSSGPRPNASASVAEEMSFIEGTREPPSRYFSKKPPR